MKNVFNIRKDENLMWIIDEDNTTYAVQNENSAVIVYLYYQEDILYYCNMIKCIPETVDIYVVSSVGNVLEHVKGYLTQYSKSKICYILKENRGRDVSAFLVACSNVFYKYKYVCFLHDKKVKAVVDEQDGKLWIENLWTNMIGTKAYVCNVIQKLEESPEIGLLVPPEPIGDCYPIWYRSGWMNDYENTKELANQLGLKCDISKEYSPITYGSTFWCRSEALRKLLDKEWTYEDFPEEPLAIDGTISHAIERVLAYVAQDAGYKTGTIMTKAYAAKQIMIIQRQMMESYEFIEERTGLTSVKELKIIDKKWDDIKKIFSDYPKVYLYGAGAVAKRYLKILSLLSCKPYGIIVSRYDNACRELDGIKIVELETLSNSEDIAIIIAASGKNKKEIMENLQRKNFERVFSFFE